MNKKQKKMLVRILTSIVILVILSFLKINEPLCFVLYMIPYGIIGYDILLKAFRGIKNKQVFDENFLMAVATLGAICLADYKEAVAVMLFYQIGELFQSYAVGKSRQSISKLMDIRPDYANIEVDGNLEKVDPDDVEVGTIITVVPGEKVPIDGIVVEGNSDLNTAALTGESIPREVGEGDEIISGSINMSGVLKIKTTKEFGESTVSKILELVENASSLKSKSENFISKFAHYYTPIVCYSALALAVLPPLVLLVMGRDAQWGSWIYKALTFLVISCPCALVISIPLSFFAGLGGASKEGILIKGSNYLEALAQVKYVVFDKTGTVTKGIFEVNGVHHSNIPNEKLVEYAAYAENYSNHPIAKSLKRAYGKEIDESRISDVKEISGHGITCKIDGKNIAVGNDKLMRMLNIEYTDCHSVGTIIHVAIENQYSGHIVISDVIKEHAKEAMEQLHNVGMKKLVMLTGDNDKTARDVAAKLNVEEVHSQLLPSDKVDEIEKILAQKTGDDKVAFVGDGINDAPVLSRVDIGIAMGGLGSDAAIEAADVVLMDDDLLKIAKAVKISKKCLRIVHENIVIAIGVKVICLLLTAFGKTNMWAGIFADVGVMIIAVLNAIRALWVKNL